MAWVVAKVEEFRRERRPLSSGAIRQIADWYDVARRDVQCAIEETRQ